MFHIPYQLGWTSHIYAIPGYFPFYMFDLLAARRANIWWHEKHLLARSNCFNGTDHVWYHIAGTLYTDPVMNSNIFLENEIVIVQGCLSNDHATDFDWF
jgi:hypothetical protein